MPCCKVVVLHMYRELTDLVKQPCITEHLILDSDCSPQMHDVNGFWLKHNAKSVSVILGHIAMNILSQSTICIWKVARLVQGWS